MQMCVSAGKVLAFASAHAPAYRPLPFKVPLPCFANIRCGLCVWVCGGGYHSAGAICCWWVPSIPLKVLGMHDKPGEGGGRVETVRKPISNDLQRRNNFQRRNAPPHAHV